MAHAYPGVPCHTDSMLTPGAQMSMQFPKSEKLALVPVGSIAPTVIALTEPDGEETQEPRLSLPPATTTGTPTVPSSCHIYKCREKKGHSNCRRKVFCVLDQEVRCIYQPDEKWSKPPKGAGFLKQVQKDAPGQIHSRQ